MRTMTALHPPCPLQCSYCCLRVYGHAYGLLLAFSPFNPFPLLSPPLSLVKGLKCTGLFAASSRLLYCVCTWAYVCVRVCLCVPLPTASKSLFPLLSPLPSLLICFFCVPALLCLAWCRRRRRMSRTQVLSTVCVTAYAVHADLGLFTTKKQSPCLSRVMSKCSFFQGSFSSRCKALFMKCVCSIPPSVWVSHVH